MSQLQANRLKTSRNDTRTENRSQTTTHPHIRGAADGTLEAEFPARPTYDLELLTVEEAVRR